MLLLCKNNYLKTGKVTNIQNLFGKTDAIFDVKQARDDKLFKIGGVFADINSHFKRNIKFMMMIKLHHYYRFTF